jgi:hypothetical protein
MLARYCKDFRGSCLVIVIVRSVLHESGDFRCEKIVDITANISSQVHYAAVDQVTAKH